MKKKLENKLEEFAEIRKFANGLQRKQLIDQEVRVYLNRAVGKEMGEDWIYAYKTYEEMYK